MACQRGSNFSTFEKMLMWMEEFAVIIEDKRTDTMEETKRRRKKEETWVMLAERFNGSTGIKETGQVATESLLEKLKGKGKKGCGRREEGDV